MIRILIKVITGILIIIINRVIVNMVRLTQLYFTVIRARAQTLRESGTGPGHALE